MPNTNMVMNDLMATNRDTSQSSLCNINLAIGFSSPSGRFSENRIVRYISKELTAPMNIHKL